MIVIDTNVISEAMSSAANRAVIDWLDTRARDELYTTSVTAAELYAGAAILPDGKRRRRLSRSIDEILSIDFEGRVLPFDAAAASAYAGIVARRRSSGRPVAIFDAQIAAIALVRGGAVATRNGRDFDGTGVAVIDPWTV